MGLCTQECCNPELRKARLAAEQATFEARKAAFEAYMNGERPKAVTEPEVGTLTAAEVARLTAWANAHPVAG